MLLVIGGLFLANGTSEDIGVLLLGEVNIIVSVWVGELCGVVSIIFEQRIRSKLSTVFPGLQLEIGHGSTTIEVGNLHCSSVGLVVDDFSTGPPLLLLGKGIKNVIWADLHNADLLVGACLSCLRFVCGASLVFSDLTVATAGDHVVLKRHILGVLHDRVAVTTLSGTESLLFAVGDPVVVSLVLLVILLEGIIERTVQPIELRNTAEIPGHLRVIIGCIVITSTNRVDLLIEI